MKFKYFIFSLGIIILSLIIMSRWGNEIFLLHPGRFMKSEWDKGVPIEEVSLNGIVTGTDEGRGLKIWVNHSDSMLKIKGIVPIDLNAKQTNSPYIIKGDSIIKIAKCDTFKLIRKNKLSIWRVEQSTIK